MEPSGSLRMVDPNAPLPKNNMIMMKFDLEEISGMTVGNKQKFVICSGAPGHLYIVPGV